MPRRSAPQDATVARSRERKTATVTKIEAEPVDAPRTPWLTAFRVGSQHNMQLSPAPLERAWLDATQDRFGYRCLPVLIANQAGWFIISSHTLEVVWDGGDEVEATKVTYQSGEPPYPALSHFGHGILTWHIPFLFQTPPGVQLLARGPANWPKADIYALEGLVETEWAAATFTMNWQMLRPHARVVFEPGDPVCMVVPISVDLLERTEPKIRRLPSEPGLDRQFAIWSDRRSAFLRDLHVPGSDAAAQGWQKEYFRGVAPDGSKAPSHRTRLKLAPFFDEDGTTPVHVQDFTPLPEEPPSDDS